MNGSISRLQFSSLENRTLNKDYPLMWGLWGMRSRFQSKCDRSQTP
ncbi:MAG: hypothetical protein AB1589_05040 [Cyanobacteriota bacterium]